MATESSYAGDVTPQEAWKALADQPAALLVDVRTAAEWSYVGLADLGALGKSALLIEWQSFPGMEVNERFVDQLGKAVDDLGLGRGGPVYFLCRSGGRSRAAAIAAAAAGYVAFNIVDGFEGALGPDRHRSSLGGWKASGLPWTQS